MPINEITLETLIKRLESDFSQEERDSYMKSLELTVQEIKEGITQT